MEARIAQIIKGTETFGYEPPADFQSHKKKALAQAKVVKVEDSDSENIMDDDELHNLLGV